MKSSLIIHTQIVGLLFLGQITLLLTTISGLCCYCLNNCINIPRNYMFKALYNFFFPLPKPLPETKTTFDMAIQSADDMRHAANDFTKAAKELTDKLR